VSIVGISVVADQGVSMPVDQNTSCAICLNNFYAEFGQYGQDFNGEILAEVAPCGHYYHQSCIQTWYNTPGGNQLCPVCQGALGGWVDVTNEAYDDYYQEAYGYMLDD
jgi:hypothetical protein